LRITAKSKERLAAQRMEDNGKTVIVNWKTTKYYNNNNIVDIATSTGSSSTILPSDKPNLDTATALNNNDNNNNNNITFIVYVEVDYCSEYIDDDAFLSSEDYDFVFSIQSPTFFGICLPTLETISPKLVDKACKFQYFSNVTRQMQSSKASSVLFNLKNYYNYIIRLAIYNNYLYRIFLWDPGILDITHLDFHFAIYLSIL